jgi:Domain of unknown function (DUF2828)
MKFVDAIKNQETRTTNGMKARVSSANACVDLFYNIGASRGKNIVPAFTAAYVENSDLALRIAQWARDVRGGSGEREIFRDILRHLEKTNPTDAARLLMKVPEVGRWDDVFVFTDNDLKAKAYTMLGDALRASNGLAAKWTPRKGKIAAEIRQFFGMTPKQYRKSLVGLTNVVETQMCANDWDNINYSHVPSVAHARYKKAFGRHGQTYAEYVSKLVKGESGVKINASAIFPYDVLKGRIGRYNTMSKQELDVVQAQWDALPNYVGASNVLPMVDSSGSMTCAAGGYNSKSGLTCLEVAISLGLYFADKNTGKFKDTFLTFSRSPKLVNLKGNINDKIHQMNTGEVANTNLHAAMQLILDVAVKNNVPQAEMPDTLLILSDMQFDQGVDRDESAMEMIERKFKEAGYTVPQVVFWNLNASYGNTPVKFDKKGTALVSGFSPAVAGGIMGGNMDDFTPEAVMLKTVMKPRYDLA